MLWNVESAHAIRKLQKNTFDCAKSFGAAEDTENIENVANQSIEEMDLVEIRSHDAPNDKSQRKGVLSQEEESKKAVISSEEVKGFALTVKESFVDSVLHICERIRPASFLRATSAAVMAGAED